VRRLNKPSESPIHGPVTLRSQPTTTMIVCQSAHIAASIYSRTKLARQFGAAKKRQMLSSYKPCTQPTDEYRSRCVGNFANAKLFRLHSRALNLAYSFAAFGIKYSAVNQSFAPPYFMKVNGMPYWRMLFVNNASEPPASPLHMYMYDSDYHIKDNPLPQQLRDVVKRCMLQSNDLAKKAAKPHRALDGPLFKLGLLRTVTLLCIRKCSRAHHNHADADAAAMPHLATSPVSALQLGWPRQCPLHVTC
jgi:hypothetical protein